ncbi:unnamed protein product [Ixodes pacificus]
MATTRRTAGQNSDGKKVEEKRYSQFSRDSILLFAESYGISDVSQQALAVLTEDLNYRLRELAQNSGQFMRHSKRRKLTCEDVQRAMRWSDTEPVYGCSGPDPLPFRHVREAEVYCTDDHTVDLLEELESPLQLQIPRQPSLQGRWLVVEGVAIGAEPTGAVKGGASSLNRDSGVASTGQNAVQTQVTPSHMQYYEEVTVALLGSDEQLVEASLEDLASNPCLSPLLPYLVHFISLGVRKLSHDLANLDRLLRTVHALAHNPNLFLNTRPYPTLLVQALLFCLLEPLAAAINPVNDHWALRDSAARLLASLLKKWGDRAYSLHTQVLEALGECLKEPSKPLCAQYGAVSGLIALGVPVLCRVFCPALATYWPQLEAVLADSRPTSTQMQSDATKVHGAMLLAAELIILQRHRELPRSEAGLASYTQLYECFGDALATRLPTLHVSHLMYMARREPAGTSSPTGEQLLEAFYEDERSMSADEDNNSEDSGLSGPPPGALHPQVKSTISDPARGIRLTIALRRPTVDPPKAKRKRTPDPREPPFEAVPLVLPRKRGHMVICFEGATPLLPRAKEEPIVPVPECRMAQLSRRMGRVGRSRRRKVAPFRSRHLGAGIDSLL